MTYYGDLDRVRGAQRGGRGGFRVLGEAVWITQGSLLHPTLVDVPSVQPVSALATKPLPPRKGVLGTRPLEVAWFEIALGSYRMRNVGMSSTDGDSSHPDNHARPAHPSHVPSA